MKSQSNLFPIVIEDVACLVAPKTGVPAELRVVGQDRTQGGFTHVAPFRPAPRIDWPAVISAPYPRNIGTFSTWLEEVNPHILTADHQACAEHQKNQTPKHF